MDAPRNAISIFVLALGLAACGGGGGGSGSDGELRLEQAPQVVFPSGHWQGTTTNFDRAFVQIEADGRFWVIRGPRLIVDARGQLFPDGRTAPANGYTFQSAVLGEGRALYRSDDAGGGHMVFILDVDGIDGLVLSQIEGIERNPTPYAEDDLLDSRWRGPVIPLSSAGEVLGGGRTSDVVVDSLGQLWGALAPDHGFVPVIGETLQRLNGNTWFLRATDAPTGDGRIFFLTLDHSKEAIYLRTWTIAQTQNGIAIKGIREGILIRVRNR